MTMKMGPSLSKVSVSSEWVVGPGAHHSEEESCCSTIELAPQSIPLCKEEEPVFLLQSTKEGCCLSAQSWCRAFHSEE